MNGKAEKWVSSLDRKQMPKKEIKAATHDNSGTHRLPAKWIEKDIKDLDSNEKFVSTEWKFPYPEPKLKDKEYVAWYHDDEIRTKLAPKELKNIPYEFLNEDLFYIIRVLDYMDHLRNAIKAWKALANPSTCNSREHYKIAMSTYHDLLEQFEFQKVNFFKTLYNQKSQFYYPANYVDSNRRFVRYPSNFREERENNPGIYFMFPKIEEINQEFLDTNPNHEITKNPSIPQNTYPNKLLT